MTVIRRRPKDCPAIHKRSAATARGADGVAVALPLCLSNSWQLTDDWHDVTCGKCLRRRPVAERKEPWWDLRKAELP